MDNNNITVYVLELEYGKYYVGSTTGDVYERIIYHMHKKASAWTSMYAYVKTAEIIPNSDCYDETEYTLQYMSKYGVDNVRGGQFTSIELSPEQLKQIQVGMDISNDFSCSEVAGNDSTILSSIDGDVIIEIGSNHQNDEYDEYNSGNNGYAFQNTEISKLIRSKANKRQLEVIVLIKQATMLIWITMMICFIINLVVLLNK